MENDNIVYEDPVAVEEEAWDEVPEVKIIMMVVGKTNTPGAIGVEDANRHLAGWLAGGWNLVNSQFLPAGPDNFKLCLLMVRG